jgi:RNA polymerase sigma-70 factor (ECF subfamily)
MSRRVLVLEDGVSTVDYLANGLGGEELIAGGVGDCGQSRAAWWPAQAPAANVPDAPRATSNARGALLAAYLERRDDLVRFFTHRLRSPAAGEDLVQDIYVRIVTLERGADVRNATGYLYRLGSNLMLDKIRSERRRAARDHSWRDSHRTLVGADEVSEDPAADDAVAARQRLEAVIAVVRGLPAQTQRVFRMHKFDGQTHAEVALTLGISRSAVEKHCMAALRQFEQHLQ